MQDYRLLEELDFIKCNHCGFGIVPGQNGHCSECEPLQIIRRLQAERDSMELIVTKVRGVLRTAYVPEIAAMGEIKVVRQWWEGLTAALEEFDVVSDRK